MLNFKFLNSLCAFLFINLLAFSGFSQGTEPQEKLIKLSLTESFYTITHIVDETQPTLIFLPGIYRGFLQDEKFLSLLTKKNINWVAYHSSRHPESILRGVPNPWLRPVSSQDLAHEVLKLKQNLRIKLPIVVSLSYSSSITPYLNKRSFPVVVETAPMGISQETTPPSPYYESWKKWMGLFPVLGPIAVESQEYWAYRGFWLQETTDLAKHHTQYNKNLTGIAEGLAQLAFAARSFDLRQQDFAKGPMRFWIVGESENKVRKSLQMEAIQLYEQQTGHRGSAYQIKNAGHIIPNENPKAFVQVLSQLVQKLAQ